MAGFLSEHDSLGLCKFKVGIDAGSRGNAHSILAGCIYIYMGQGSAKARSYECFYLPSNTLDSATFHRLGARSLMVLIVAPMSNDHSRDIIQLSFCLDVV